MQNRNESWALLARRIFIHVLVVVFALPVGAVPHARAQTPAAQTASATTAPGVVNVNTATEEELTRLPGVGPAKAQAILEARARRPFRRLSDLRRVSGIGRRTLERLAPMIAFEGATTLAARRR